MSVTEQYGGAAIFVALFLEYVGVPVPGVTLLAFLGFLNWKGSHTSIYSSMFFASAGTFTGSSLAWWLGYKYGKSILVKYGRYFFVTGEKLEIAESAFIKHRRSLLLFGRFFPGVRHFVPYFSGISKMGFALFSGYNLIGSVIWCGCFLWLGLVLGEKWAVVERLSKVYSSVLLLLALAVFFLVRFISKRPSKT